MKRSFEERVRLSQATRARRDGQPCMVPLGPVIKRIDELAPYVSHVELARRLNIPINTMHMWRHRVKKGGKVTRMYADRVMNYQLPSEDTCSKDRIRGAQRIYRGLAARGWGMQFICDQVGLDSKGFRNLVCSSPDVKRGLSREMFAELKRVAAKLETQDPYDMLSIRSVNTTKGKAHTGDEQWVDIGAWDLDTVHLADSVPDLTGACGTLTGCLIHLREGQALCGSCQHVASHPISKVDPVEFYAAQQRGMTRDEIAELFGVDVSLVSKYIIVLDGGRRLHSLSYRNHTTMRGDCEVCGPGVQLYRSGAKLQCAEPIRAYREAHGNDHGRKR